MIDINKTEGESKVLFFSSIEGYPYFKVYHISESDIETKFKNWVADEYVIRSKEGQPAVNFCVINSTSNDVHPYFYVDAKDAQLPAHLIEARTETEEEARDITAILSFDYLKPL